MERAELEAIRRDLAALVGAHAVSVRATDRALYSRDASVRTLLRERHGEFRHPPDVVVWPASTEETARVVRYARGRQLPLVPFGAGSGTVGGTIPLRAGVVVDLKRMRRVVPDLPHRRALAQAGAVGERLEDELGRAGATLGHFPLSLSCSTLGGWIATRSAGYMSAPYGKIEDMVLGLTAVAGTGEVLRTGAERVPGPDLVQLLAGSEGVLALVTEAVLRIHPKPAARALRGVRVKSVEAGLAAMQGVLRAGLRPHLLRLYDPVDSLALDSGGPAPRGGAPSAPARLRARLLGLASSAPRLLNGAAELLPPRCLLVLAFEAEAQARAEDELRAALDVCREAGGADVGEAPARRWYRRRFAGAHKVTGVYSGRGWADTMELAATWDRAPAVLAAVRRAAVPHALCACHFTHAYLEGVSLCFSFLGPALSVEEGEASHERCWRASLDAALAAGASISHHQGVGVHKLQALPGELGDGGMRLLRALKAAFDPDGILNPGKLLA